MQIAVTLYDRSKPIPSLCQWGDYAVVAIRDVRVNGCSAKLLTLAPWKITETSDVPFPLHHYDEQGRWLFTG